MSRKSVRTRNVVNYRTTSNIELSDSEESEDEDQLYNLSDVVYKSKKSVINRKTTTRKRSVTSRKQVLPVDTISSDDDHAHISKKSKRKTVPKITIKAMSNGSATEVHDLISDDDSVDLGDAKVSRMKNKVDQFFKVMESSDDDFELESIKPGVQHDSKKDQGFCEILADSDEDMKCSKQQARSNDKFSHSVPSTSFAKVDNVINSTQDPFAIVDEIINFVDDNPVQVSKPEPETESFEDYKKKTDEILESVSSLIENLNKSEKPVKVSSPESPKKAAPSCAICLENLGGEIQAMVTFCGHMFCKDCIQTVVKTTKKCPTCRKTITAKKIHPVYI